MKGKLESQVHLQHFLIDVVTSPRGDPLMLKRKSSNKSLAKISLVLVQDRIAVMYWETSAVAPLQSRHRR